MRVCAFCGVSLKEVERAKEHVIKRAWLDQLGALNQPLIMESEEKGQSGIKNRREMTPNQMLAGEVCKECNGGWMDSLDNSVADLVLPEANGLRVLEGITSRQAVSISRWIFKVACCLDITSSKRLRRISPEVIRAVKEPEFLPSGFVSFFSRVPAEFVGYGVGPSISDRWKVMQDPNARRTRAEFERIHRESVEVSRIKFAVHLAGVVFGCAYTTLAPNPEFVLMEHLHRRILSKGSRVAFRPLQSTNDPWINSASCLLADTVHLRV